MYTNKYIRPTTGGHSIAMHIFLNLCTMEEYRFSGKDVQTILGEEKKEFIQT